MKKVVILSFALVVALSFAPAFGAQLLLNPSFESPSALSDPDVWVCLPGGCGEFIVDGELFGGGIDPATTTYPDGSQVVRMYVTNWGGISSPHGYYQSVPVVSGQSYTLTGKMRTTTSNPWGDPIPVNAAQGRLGVDRDGSSSDLASVDVWCASAGAPVDPDGWIVSDRKWGHLTTTFTANASTVTVYLDSRNTASNGWSGVHFDLVQLDGPDPGAPTPTPTPTITPVPYTAFNGDFSQGSQGGGETVFANNWQFWYIQAGIYGVPLTGIDPFPGAGTASQRFKMIDFGIRAGKQMDTGLSAFVQVLAGIDYNLSAEFVKEGTAAVSAIQVNLGVELSGALPPSYSITTPASFPDVDWVSEETLAQHTPGLDTLCIGGTEPKNTPFTVAFSNPFQAVGNVISVHVEVQTLTDLEERIGYVDNVTLSASTTDIMRERWSLYR